MRRTSRLLEMRRRSRLPEMMTMKTKHRRHRFRTEGHCRGHGFRSNKRTSGEHGEDCRFRSGAPSRTEIPRVILQQKTKLGRAGIILWVPADYKSAVWHSVGEYCVAARSYATEAECQTGAAVASATGGVPAPIARKRRVKAKRLKNQRKTPTKSGGKQEEEDAGEGDKEDTEKKDEVAVQVSGRES